jgi:phytoene dehydrogenase-like protein
MLHRFYPKLKGKEDFVDISTPLSIEHYLKCPGGGAVGLEPTPERYGGKEDLLEHLDVVTKIPNLYMTGQDTLICGVVLAQASGIITAFRVMGFFNSIKIVLRTMLHGG